MPVDRATDRGSCRRLRAWAYHGVAVRASAVIISPQSAGGAEPSNAHDRYVDALGAEAAIGIGARSHVSAAFLGAIAEPRVRQRIFGGIRHDRRARSEKK